jgi:hypothetical protein
MKLKRLTESLARRSEDLNEDLNRSFRDARQKPDNQDQEFFVNTEDNFPYWVLIPVLVAGIIGVLLK